MTSRARVWAVILIVVLTLIPSSPIHAVAGTWTAVTSMGTARVNHTLTLLPDGKVLAVGGANLDTSTLHSSAELFNPSDNSWIATTGNMSTGRQSHTATLLTTGKVLIAGGLGATNGTERSSAELYDPANGTFSGTGSMSQARNSHKAVRLLDGRVLVVGGSANNSPLNSAEIYDPVLGTWSAAASLATAKGGFAMVLMADGRVMVAGGFAGGEVKTFQIYNPGTNSWTAEANMNDLRSNSTATLLSDGQILLAGGDNAFPTTNKKTELYNPGTSSWSYTTGDLAIVRASHRAFLLPDGKVLVAAGFSNSATSTAELYNPTTGTWSTTGSLVGNRTNEEQVMLADGRVLATGGFNISSFADLASAEIYEPAQLNNRCGLSAGPQVFHFGGTTLTVNISTLGDIDCIKLTAAEITHPNATANMQTTGYWQIDAVNSGGNPASGYTLSLTLPNPFGTVTGVKACRFPGGLGGSGWDCTVSQSATNSQVTVTGVTQLSAWTVGQNVGPTAMEITGLSATSSATLPLLAIAAAAVLVLVAGMALRRNRLRLT